MRQKVGALFSSKLLKHIIVAAVWCRAGFCPVECQTLIYGIENEIKDTNISRSLDKNAFNLTELVTEALFWQRPNGEQVRDLALSETYNKKEWRIKLRSSTFSNGHPLTCSDVRANLEEARQSPRPVSARLKEISSIECEGNLLVIKTVGPAPQLMSRIGHVFRIYDPATLDSKTPVGSGPYQIAGPSGKDLVLRPNKFYPGTANFSEIRFRALRDPWLRDLALFSGNIDFLLETFSRIRLRSYEQNPAVKLFRNPSTVVHYLALNPAKFSTATRIAIRTLIYQSKAVEEFWGNDAQPTQKLFAVESLPATRPLPTPSNITLEVTCAADETQLQFLKVLAQKLASSHIQLKIRALEFANLMKQINGRNYDAYLHTVDASHPQNLEALLGTRGGRLGLADGQIDRVFNVAARGSGAEATKRVQQKLDDLVADGAYLVPLYRQYRTLVTGRRLHIEQTSDGFWRDLLRGYK